MGKKWLLACLFALFFFVFIAGAAKEIWNRQTVSQNEFTCRLIASVDTFDEFGKEIITVLAETLPDKKSFDAIYKMIYLREDSYGDEILIVLYAESDSGKDVIIWSVEKRKMKNAKTIRELAEEAAYSVLHRVGRDLPAIPPETAKVKKTVL